MGAKSSKFSYRWAAPGDFSAFLGLTFDNIAQLIVFSGALIGIFGFPADVVLGRMLPGTAIGVLIGNLIYTGLAFRLAQREQRDDVTAMPLGIDTVSLFGLTFGAIGPVYLQTQDAMLAWQVGMALMVVMGVFKIAVTWFANALRHIIPPAAMLGTIGAVGIAFIAFMPMLEIFSEPMVGIFALFAMLLVLLKTLKLPAYAPPVLIVVVLSTLLYFGLNAFGLLSHPPQSESLSFSLTLPWPTVGFLGGMSAAVDYLPLAIPFAFATVIGGIDNTESAAAAGDRYDTRAIVLTEGVSTLVAAFFGGVIQTTPYIGHPAYKRMGGRAAYTLATGLVVGLGGTLGVLSWLVGALPGVIIVPILVFVGLEIAAQAFHAVPKRHGPAVAVCFLPVLASVALILINQMLAGAGVNPEALTGDAAGRYQALMLLAAGFVFSAMLYGSALAHTIDGKFRAAAIVFWLGALASLFGIIHSPFPGAPAFLPWNIDSPLPFAAAGGYGLLGVSVLILGMTRISAPIQPEK